MKKIFLPIFLFFNLTIYSQELKSTKKIVRINIDPLENIFLCEEKKIIKINKSNNEKLEYDFSKYGKLNKIITKNPFRTTVFFKESQTIIFLDKNLNKLNLELKLQSIQNEIISDIETHSNLIFLLSEQSNTICVYDFKKLKTIHCNSKIDIIKNKYLKLFLNQGSVFLLNDREILVLNENLITLKKTKIENCEKLFFNEDSLYLIIKNNLFKSSIIDLNNLIFIKPIPKNNLFYIDKNVIFGIKNNFFLGRKIK